MRDEVLFALLPFIHNRFDEIDQPEKKLLLTKSKGKERWKLQEMTAHRSKAPV